MAELGEIELQQELVERSAVDIRELKLALMKHTASVSKGYNVFV